MSNHVAGIQLKISFTVPGRGSLTRTLNNTINYFSDSSGAVGSQLLDFITKWALVNQAAMLACVDYSTVLAAYTAYWLDRPDYVQTVTYPALHGTYNMTPGAPLPSTANAYLYLKTAARGKGSWGGIHLGGLPIASLPTGTNGNVFTAPYQAILDAYLATLLTTVTDTAGSVWRLGILSRTRSSLIIPPPAVNVQMFQVYANDSGWDDQMKSLRRREIGLVRA